MRDDDSSDGPDPRLEIPPELRDPPRGLAPAQKPSPDAGMWGMAKAWGIALDFIFTIIAGALLGWAYDQWKATAPTGLMLGLAAGFVVAFIRIVRATMKQERLEQAARKRRNPPPA